MAVASGTATFAAADSASLTFSPSLTSNPPSVIGYGVTPTDGFGPVEVSITNLTNTGCTVNASGPFTGTVAVTAKD